MKRSVGTVTVAVMTLITSVLLVIFFVRFTSTNPKTLGLGDETFILGASDRFSKDIANDGPIFFPDLLHHQLGTQVYVNHIGSNPNTGWHAFESRIDGEARDCTLEWHQAQRQFVSPCSHRHIPADGTGLATYKVTVLADKRVEIDFRSAGLTP